MRPPWRSSVRPAGLKFYRRMCRDHRSVDTFLKNQPQRSVENQRLELAALPGQVGCRPAEDAIYTKVVIADKDLVVPTANQLAFWQGKEVHRMEETVSLLWLAKLG